MATPFSMAWSLIKGAKKGVTHRLDVPNRSGPPAGEDLAEKLWPTRDEAWHTARRQAEEALDKARNQANEQADPNEWVSPLLTDPHELRTQQFQEGIQGLRDLFNQPSPDNFNPITAIEGANTSLPAGRDGFGQVRRGRDADGGLTALNEDARNASRASSHAALVEAFERGHGQNHEDDAPPPINQDAVEAVTAHLTGGGSMDEDPRHKLQGTLSMPQSNLNRFDANFPDYPDHPIHGKQNISVQQRVNRQRNERDMKDAREEAKNNLIDNPPKLVRDEGGFEDNESYRVKVGDKNVGHVMVRGRDRGEHGVRGRDISIGAGEIDHDYQRQGLYGRALQAIMAEHGSVTSYNRNNNSGAFHEQFNPPHAKKEVDPSGHDGSYDDDDRVKYTHKPPEPIPGWGGITPDTGALPIHNERQPETMASTTVTGITKPPNYPGYANYGTRNKPMATSYPDWTSPETVNIPPPGGWRNVGDTF